MVDANPAIERLARLAFRSNLGNTIGAVKVHTLEAVGDVLLRNTSGSVEDEARLTDRTFGGNTVHVVEDTSNGAFWSHRRGAALAVAVGTRLANREIRKLAVSSNKS
jgi:hypothetical protein